MKVGSKSGCKASVVEFQMTGEEKVAVVVTPLKGLIQDQAANLRRLGIDVWVLGEKGRL